MNQYYLFLVIVAQYLVILVKIKRDCIFKTVKADSLILRFFHIELALIIFQYWVVIASLADVTFAFLALFYFGRICFANFACCDLIVSHYNSNNNNNIYDFIFAIGIRNQVKLLHQNLFNI